MRWYTDLRLVFEAFGGRQREFDWLLTDIDLIHVGAAIGEPEPPLGPEPLWLSGADLTRTAESFDIHFVWAVLSGFQPGTRPDLTALKVYPYADGNSDFWGERPGIQHPRAEVEIVCWDSTCTLLLSRDDDLTRRFRAFFPEAVDLDAHNHGPPVDA